MRLGIVAALPVEARCLLDRKVKPGERAALGRNPQDNDLQDIKGWVQLSGMGPQNARHAAESLLEMGATALISWGVAAGLAPELRRGDLVLPKSVITADGHSFAIDHAWHARVYGILSDSLIRNSQGSLVNGGIETSTGNLAETVTALTAPAEKATLFQRTGAVAADMESAAVGAVAQQAGVPFLVVRAVVDGFATSLPPAAMAAMDMSGKFHALPWLKALLQHPAQLPDMLPLALGLFAARATLARVVKLTGPRLRFQE